MSEPGPRERAGGWGDIPTPAHPLIRSPRHGTGWLALASLLFGLVAAIVFAMPSPAHAHATLLFTTPRVDGAVPDSPPEVQLVFDQPVVPARSTLTVTGPDGATVPLGQVTSGHQGQTVTALVGAELDTGEYVVEWLVTAKDGDTMTGEFRFAVGSGAGLGRAQVTTDTRAAELITALRWLLFAGLALLLGGVVGDRLARRTAIGVPMPRPWVVQGALLSTLGALGLAFTQAGGGSVVQGVLDPSVSSLVASAPGRLAALELLLLSITTLLLLAARRTTHAALLVVVPTVAFAAGVAVLEGLRAHPDAVLPGWGAALVTVHLIAAAIWVGALIHVIRVAFARRRAGQAARAIIVAYARIALWLAIVVVTAGTLSALVVIPLGELPTVLPGTAYGRWLIAKLALVALALAIAAYARWHMARRRSPPMVAVRIEAVVLAGVLVTSAALTALAPPASKDLPLPFPPPAVGPVVAVGDRAGWIGIGATASQGQLVIRLSTPDTTGGLDPTAVEEYSLVGSLAAPDATEHQLRFRLCGAACFVAPVDWAAGHSTVTLEADTERFEGGSAALVLPWVPAQRPELLRAAVKATGAERQVVVYEQVTSDTSSGLGDLAGLPMAGDEYVGVGPYGSGRAPIVVLLDRTDGERTIALGYPGEATYVRLTLDHHDRIVREVLAAPNHLVTRTLVYPGEHEHP